MEKSCWTVKLQLSWWWCFWWCLLSQICLVVLLPSDENNISNGDRESCVAQMDQIEFAWLCYLKFMSIPISKIVLNLKSKRWINLQQIIIYFKDKQ